MNVAGMPHRFAVGINNPGYKFTTRIHPSQAEHPVYPDTNCNLTIYTSRGIRGAWPVPCLITF